MLQPLGVDGADLVDVEVQLRGLGGNPLGDLGELGVGAAHDGAGAGALGGTVVGAQTSHVIPVCKGVRCLNKYLAKVSEVFMYLFFEFAT